jgi:DNA-binding NarL/FixJ family response regulator
MSTSSTELALPTFCSSNSQRVAVFSPEGLGAGLLTDSPLARVLIVEDDYFVSGEIEAILIDMHCEIVGIAATGEEAIEIAQRERPDLVLMDIRLAGLIDGIATAKVMDSRLGIRCLYVTAHSDVETRTRGQATNPLGWVSKPFTSQELTKSVRRAIQSLA